MIEGFIERVYNLISRLIASMAHRDTIGEVPVDVVITTEIEWDNVFPSYSVWVVFILLFPHSDIACWTTFPDAVVLDVSIPFFSRTWSGHFLSLGKGGVKVGEGRE